MAAELDDHAFWKEQFDFGGNHPSSWFQKAWDLLAAADALDRFSGNRRDLMFRSGKSTRLEWEQKSVLSVSDMLKAMAIECLLKALWLKTGGVLVADGKYVGILKKNEHRLHELAKAIAERDESCALSERDLDLLEFVSFFIVAGRYGVPRI